VVAGADEGAGEAAAFARVPLLAAPTAASVGGGEAVAPGGIVRAVSAVKGEG
jgi:hypothetical protein